MFCPYTANHGLAGLKFHFATQQAADWYDPIKPHVALEYQWLLENVHLNHARVIDAGAHHGHYSLVFARAGAYVRAVDPHPDNLKALTLNMELNGFWDYSFLRAAAWKADEEVWFSGQSNGMVGGFTGVQVPGRTLMCIDPLADVVKMDIEGAEYVVAPACINEMKAHTWIVEVHLSDWRHHNFPNSPDLIARLFKRRGFQLDWVNRERMVVEPYNIGTAWATHSTLIARRPR